MPFRPSLPRLLAVGAAATAMVIPLGLSALPSAAATAIHGTSKPKAPKVIDGPDVSHYQHPAGRTINWTKVAAAGKDFAISKATEGTTYTDPWFATDYAASRAAGLVHGSYHFAHPALPLAKTAREQATFFANTVGAVDTTKTLPPALDLETTGGLNAGQLVTWAQDFMLDMRSITGRTPLLYTYPSFYSDDLRDPAAVARYPLWMAEYGVSQAPVSDLWQFTDNARIKGIHAAVDESQFRGSSGWPWKTLSNGTIATPWTAAAPGAPTAVTASVQGEDVHLSWLPGDAGTSRILRYIVTASPGGKVAVLDASHFSTTVQGLSTSQTYRFRVRAVNAIGHSVGSALTPAVQPVAPTTLTTTVGTSLVNGGGLPLRTVLTRTDTHAPITGETVLVFRRGTTDSPWHQIRKLTTSATGVVSTVLEPHHSAQLEVVFAGEPGLARATTFENYVVHPVLTAALSATTVVHGTSVTLRGTISPVAAGQTVTREWLDDGVWKTRGTATVTKHGTFSFAVLSKYKGTKVFRVIVTKQPRLGQAHSPRVTLTVS